MGLKKGDIIDEHKHHPDSCGLVVKVMGGGEGFEKVVCCGHDLTDKDLIPKMGFSKGRKKGRLPVAIILDEKKLFPNSCGLRVMIMDGGAGFREIVCCGNSLNLESMREFQYGERREESSDELSENGPQTIPGPTGNA